MERGPVHQREDAIMSKLQPQSQKVQTSQLLYRPSGRKTTKGVIIRSEKTADLLRLTQDGTHQSEHSFAAGNAPARVKPLRRGGFICSRMTAELLGLDLLDR